MPADKDANLGAKFFNDTTGELIEEIPNFAAAHVDATKGSFDRYQYENTKI